MDITITIPDRNIEGVKYMLLEYFGLQTTNDFIKDILKINVELIQEVIDDTYEDTCIRERFIDAISKMVVNEEWPAGKNTKEYSEKFFDKFSKNAIKFNIGIIE